MKIVLSGGTGFIGEALCRHLLAAGHRVTVLTRDLARAWQRFGAGPELLHWGWGGRGGGDWRDTLEDADAIVNLAGAPIAEARWTVARKRLLLESRLAATRRLVDALSTRGQRPVVFVSASGIGYYGASDDRLLDERASRGAGFLADLSHAWEAEAMRAESLGARVVRLRLGMVLERDGGALPRMLLPFRVGLGGPIRPGTQWVSWIHRQDVIGLIEWALNDTALSGPLNAVAPEAVRMTEFCRILGRVLHRPSWLPVPEFALKLGLGELGTLLTTGQRVSPMVATSNDFPFRYPELESALRAILQPAAQAGTSRSIGSRMGPPVARRLP